MLSRPLGLFLVAAVVCRAQTLAEFEKKVTEFTLGNGMHFIVAERHQAPVVAFDATVNAGSVDDPSGESSMAHMFEHMIGKGTTALGSKNWPQERRLLEAVERAYDKYDELRRRGSAADKNELQTREAELQKAMEQANALVVPNEFTRVISEQGGAGFNAGTAQDYTTYFYSLPSNRAELWFLLQSEWFRRPVFREFYKERDVVREERRMRVESDVQGKLEELLLATAFMAHPYRNLIGWASEIENLRARDAEQFFRKYYVPGNITVSIVGDVDPAQMKRFAEKYFASIPAAPLPPPVGIEEPPQEGEKRVALESESQPLLMVAYKRPNQTAKDDPVFDVISGILSSGRTGLLYQRMVRDKQVAIDADAVATVPGGKYPNLFMFYSVPAPGHTTEENEREFYSILDRLKEQKVDDETMNRVRTKIRAGLIQQLDSNTGLASQLAYYHIAYGNWRVMFTGLEDINRVSAEDVQRVVRQYFIPRERTVAFTVAPPVAAPASGSEPHTEAH